MSEGWEIEKLIAFNSTTDERKLPTKTIRHVIGDAILIDYHRFFPFLSITKFPRPVLIGCESRVAVR